MKLKDLIQELKESQHYKNFKQQNPETFFAAGFFILDLENRTEQIQLDYFLPKEKQIAAFEHPWTEPKVFNEEIKEMRTQLLEIKIDIDDLEPICQKTIKENNSLIAPKKIIAILKNNQWNLTCMDNALGIVRIKLDATTGETQDFDKGSLMDFMGIQKK